MKKKKESKKNITVRAPEPKMDFAKPMGELMKLMAEVEESKTITKKFMLELPVTVKMMPDSGVWFAISEEYNYSANGDTPKQTMKNFIDGLKATIEARMKPITQVDAVVCDSCGDTIFSRARHDMRWCGCKSVAIDGGFDYFKISGNLVRFRRIRISVTASKNQLYDDWNQNINKYGIIKAKKVKRVVD